MYCPLYAVFRPATPTLDDMKLVVGELADAETDEGGRLDCMEVMEVMEVMGFMTDGGAPPAFIWAPGMPMKEGRFDWGTMQELMGFWPGSCGGCCPTGDIDDARGEAMFGVPHGDA